MAEEIRVHRMTFPAPPPLDVLHIPFCYFPDAVGGTEVYVSGLIAALRAHGFSGAVAAPGETDASYAHNGVSVIRFARMHSSALANAHGAPDETAVQSFRTVLARLQPRIVHLHAHTAAVSERIADVAGEAGAKVVFTYHTPTASCARGTMMRLGVMPCDGRLDVHRCSACVLQSHGVPPIVREALAALPQVIGGLLGSAGFEGGAFTAMRMSALIGARQRRFISLMDKVDRIVAVCRWVADVLRANGVPEAKLTLCRQGLMPQDGSLAPALSEQSHASTGPLRLGYFGRLDPTKGADLLVEALRRAPGARLRLDIYGVRQLGSEAYAALLERAAAADQRVSLEPALGPDAVVGAMRTYDFVAVPSRWLETGPLVVLEAFAAGTPVLGARLGGVVELVTEGVDGALVAPDNPAAWTEEIQALAVDPHRVAKLRAGVRPPRTMDDVAREMAALYRAMLDD